jgi:hypothetical protein
MMTDKDTRASSLIKRFRSLVTQTEIIAFPETKNSIFLTVNMEKWHPIRRFLYKVSMPYLYAYEKAKDSIIYFFLAVFGFVMAFSSLLLAERVARSIPIEWNGLQYSLLIIFLGLNVYAFVIF